LMPADRWPLSGGGRRYPQQGSSVRARPQMRFTQCRPPH
jgi:hypothetical protein